ncbi:MAG: hypothetical protein A2Z18_07805, partial [Armatimonadetes bacterium RBG_16_58_9]
MPKNHIYPLILLLASAPTGSHAHLRDYLVTRGYWTLSQGRVESEVYNDFYDKDSGETVYVNQTEVEYGVTDRLTLGVYGVWEKAGAVPIEYAKTKFEARYRLAEYQRMIVDPALYLEYQLGANGRPDKVEAKLLLSKDFGTDWNVTFNGILEKSRGDGGEWERGFTVGVAKVLTYRLTTGLEFKSGEGRTYLI